MLIAGFPSVGLTVDVTRVEGGSPGYILVVGPDGELAQMLPLLSGFGHAEDDGTVLLVDCDLDERHRLFLDGPRAFDVINDDVGQELMLVITQRSGGGHELFWPPWIAWRDGASPPPSAAPSSTMVVRLLKIGDREWIGWYEGSFSFHGG